MRASRFAGLLLVFGALVRSVVPAGLPTPAPPFCGVTLTIAVKPSQIPDGWVEVTGVLKNEGSKPVTLVEPGDGSESGWRTPVLQWRARRIGNGQKEVILDPGPRCGLMNGPDPKREVFVLAPGASRRVRMALVIPRLEPPGPYEVRLLYINDPRIGFRGETLTDPAMSPYARSMACTAASNTLRIEAPVPAGSGTR